MPDCFSKITYSNFSPHQITFIFRIKRLQMSRFEPRTIPFMHVTIVDILPVYRPYSKDMGYQ